MSRKVLVVDDNADLADILKEILVDEGFDVTVAYTGQDGIDAYEREKHSFVVCDVQLPDINGLNVYRSLRKTNDKLRFYLSTGSRIDQILQLATKAPVSVLHEPITSSDLLKHAQQWTAESIALVADRSLDSSERIAREMIAAGKRCEIIRGVENVKVINADIVVLDLRKNVVEAIDTILTMRENNNVVPAIIVVGPGVAPHGESNLFRSWSATGCLFKPFDPDVLLDAVR